MSKLEAITRIIIGISIFYIPGLALPAIALIVIITTLLNKNQIAIVGTYCKLPEDKYEITNKRLFNLMMIIRGLFIAAILLLGWMLMLLSIGGFLTLLLTITAASIAMITFNSILEKYYTVREELT